MRSAVLAILLSLAAVLPAAADQYACETVDAAAVAYVRAGLPVSIVETNRTCEIAVDGMVAVGRSSAFTGALNNLVVTLYDGGNPAYDLPEQMLVDMLAGPFGDRNDRQGGRWSGLVGDTLDPDSTFGLSQCIRDFADLIDYNDTSGAPVPITQMGMMRGGRTECEVVPPIDDRPDVPVHELPLSVQGALRLTHRLDDVTLTLFLPVGFLQDARDGNGIFQ